MAVDACTAVKSVYSVCLLLFSVVIVMALVWTGDTRLSRDVHPALAYVVIWLATIWLAVVEGGQASLVGLPPIQRKLYKDSHPITHRCTTIAHEGDNLNRYLIGRQFLVVLIVFMTHLSGAPLEGSTVLGLPNVVQEIFLSSGLAMILMLAMIGQLSAQVNASHCMLDFINTYSALGTLYVTLAIEFSGILHTSYLIRWVVTKLAGGTDSSDYSPPRSLLQQLFFVGRVVMSLCILGFAFAVTLAALFEGKTTMWQGVPPAVSIIVFFVLMTVVGLLEGAQIAFFAVAKLQKEDVGSHPVATKTYDVLFGGEGRNLPAFMVGRQILVTMCFFIIARVTTLNVDTGAGDETIFGVPQGLQHFFNTGLLGAIITTTVGSISWQLVAAAFPLAFLRNPLVHLLLRICLLLECTGICAGAWVLASIQKRISGFQRDEVYLKGAKIGGSEVDTEAGSDRVMGRTLSGGNGRGGVATLGTEPGTFHVDPMSYIGEQAGAAEPAAPSPVGDEAI